MQRLDYLLKRDHQQPQRRFPPLRRIDILRNISIFTTLVPVSGQGGQIELEAYRIAEKEILTRLSTLYGNNIVPVVDVVATRGLLYNHRNDSNGNTRGWTARALQRFVDNGQLALL